jgi:hypothetical protein
MSAMWYSFIYSETVFYNIYTTSFVLHLHHRHVKIEISIYIWDFKIL